jgi:hypothetical protein
MINDGDGIRRAQREVARGPPRDLPLEVPRVLLLGSWI